MRAELTLPENALFSFGPLHGDGGYGCAFAFCGKSVRNGSALEPAARAWSLITQFHSTGRNRCSTEGSIIISGLKPHAIQAAPTFLMSVSLLMSSRRVPIKPTMTGLPNGFCWRSDHTTRRRSRVRNPGRRNGTFSAPL
jgi:hypothetical protein